MTTLLTCGLALGMALSFGASANANLILNGSFEEGNFTGSGGITKVLPNAYTVPNWRANSHGFDWCTPHSAGGFNLTAADGQKYVNLSYYGGLSQAFATTAGQEYLVSFQLCSPPSSPQNNTVYVSVAGLTQQFVNPLIVFSPEQKYYEFNFNFIANDSVSTLEFRSLASTGLGPSLDCVSVEAVAPVPEPATYLAGLGLLALMGAAARRKAA